MTTSPALPSTPPDVAAFLAKSRIPHARATKKLEDVLRRVAAGAPPLDLIREIWTFGSFARGALDVGDVDLYMLVDESRSVQKFSLDAYYERRHPFANQIAAMGCSGSSFVSVQVHPVFDPLGEPASPERQATVRDPSAARVVPVVEPVVEHVATGEPLAGPFVLLWARGDELDWALERLRSINVAETAGRHDRTTTVPLLDDLDHKLGIPTSFALAPQIRRGNLACRAFMLEPADAPSAARRTLEERYFNPSRKAPSVRELAGAAALHRLAAEGTDLRDVEFVDGPVTARPRKPRVFVDFNAFQLYRVAAGHYDTGDRVVNVWPSRQSGPWLAVEVEVLDPDGVGKLYRWLTAFDDGPDARHARLLEVLAEPVTHKG